MKKNNVLIITAIAILLLAFKKADTRKGTVIVENPLPQKSPDADFLIQLNKGVTLYDSNFIPQGTIGSKNYPTAIADGFIDYTTDEYYIVRLMGDNKFYLVNTKANIKIL
jgi:hypothetical protein